MEGYMLSVGYPVGVNAKDKTYILETAEGLVNLQDTQTLVWVGLTTVQHKELSGEVEKIAKHLVNKRVLYVGNTVEELFHNIQNVILHRQGCFGIDDGKYVVFVGKEICPLTMEQSIIWKYADGINTIKDISEFTEAASDIPKFMENLNALFLASAIFGK